MSSLRFAGNENSMALKTESIYKVFPESQELICNIRLTCSCWNALRESDTNGVFDPDDICQVDPSPWVRDGLVCSVLPEEWAVFLEKAFER
jgi:hypothetical protein